MTKTIAEYSATTNPWHNWILDNAEEHRAFLLKAEATTRLVKKGQWSDGYQHKYLLEYIAENGLDLHATADAWIAYEEFKIALGDYRLAKAVA